MAGFCIMDDDAVCEASRQEVIRRYYKALVAAKKGENVGQEILSLELLLKQLGITPTYRRCVQPAPGSCRKKQANLAAALELPDGRIVTG